MARADPQRLTELIVGEKLIVTATVRTVKLKIAQLNMESQHGAKSFVDLDMHADNTVLGSGCLLIHDTGCRVGILGFAAVLASIPIVTGVVAYNHPITGKVYILVFHQAIHCRLMDNHLICPMQCRVNGVVINDTPKFCIRNPDNRTQLSRSMAHWTQTPHCTSRCNCEV